MNHITLSFAGADLCALGSGALYWPAHGLLVVSDLHLGKAARWAVRGGATLPPYEARETLSRLEADIAATGAQKVLCLGDSFDAPGLAEALPEEDQLWLTRMMAGREWTWIEGNHDPGPVALGGSHCAAMSLGTLTFRHIATDGAAGEVSGHYHPKLRLNARGRMIARPCFLYDDTRLVLPAYGVYTGGLRSDDAALTALFSGARRAILTGPKPHAVTLDPLQA